jgi:hypothetical protein
MIKEKVTFINNTIKPIQIWFRSYAKLLTVKPYESLVFPRTSIPLEFSIGDFSTSVEYQKTEWVYYENKVNISALAPGVFLCDFID